MYCGWVSTRWKLVSHFIQETNLIYIKRKKTHHRAHKIESKAFKTIK